MTREELDWLLTPAAQQAVEDNLDRDSVEVALHLHAPFAAVVATQIKYLQRARHKLPSYYRARAILPSLAFEQASSEECAAHKSLSGDRVLDLTCGLGVDTLYLARRFGAVVSVERDPVLAAVARENLRRMDVQNVQVVCASAEEYLATHTAEHFDWCYVDPDRRGTGGQKLVRLEACSPDVLTLRDALARVADRTCIKCSPLFDVEEAFRLFHGCSVEAVSLAEECKEVLIYTDSPRPVLRATALGRGTFEVEAGERYAVDFSHAAFRAEDYKVLVLPDVALQKTRLETAALCGVAEVWAAGGCGFMAERPQNEVLGRVFEIVQTLPYGSHALKQALRGRRIELYRRGFPLSTAQILRSTGAVEGGTEKWCFTAAAGQLLAVQLA